MHNPYLGTANHKVENVWLNEKNDFINDEDSKNPGTGRFNDSPARYWLYPKKYFNQFLGFTADQWKNWTAV